MTKLSGICSSSLNANNEPLKYECELITIHLLVDDTLTLSVFCVGNQTTNT